MPSIPLISPDLLRRQTSGGGFLPVIDGLRFVAIGWVFVFHVAGWVAVRVYGVKGQLWNVPSSELGPLSPIASIASVGFFGVQLFSRSLVSFLRCLFVERDSIHLDRRPHRASVPTFCAGLPGWNHRTYSTSSSAPRGR
jgi:hypothetical protein